MERLRERIKEVRKKMGWAQEDLAREIGVNLSMGEGFGERWSVENPSNNYC